MVNVTLKLLPTKKQEHTLVRYVGGCRFIWNYLLDVQSERRKTGGHLMTPKEMHDTLHDLEKQKSCSWLRSMPYNSLKVTIEELGDAIHKYKHDEGEFPRFESRKKGVMELPLMGGMWHGFAFVDDSHILIAKVGKVRFEGEGEFPTGAGQMLISPRVYMDGKNWYATFGMKTEDKNESRNQRCGSSRA